ncbi:hypothetical protein JVU11DRAFT_5593 [Chiua virens]|nr:hypothetical protein JVU11DRAFT_5593 [Chiua virens]
MRATPHHRSTMSRSERDVFESAVRQRLSDECNTYIHNNLPAYLLEIRNIHNAVGRIQLSDIHLVSRSQISETIRKQIDADLVKIPKLKGQLETWCEAHIQEYKSKLRYAILSHHWGDGEPEFQQMFRQEYSSEERELPAGIRKLLGFCRVAAIEYRFQYAWSDTCCIDKKSSSELSEAIRSMYRWYEGSEICVVYLGASSLLGDLKYDPWFKRGWTLQELLAPKKIRFYGRDWTPINPNGGSQINDKKDDSMRRIIERITGIPEEDIREFRPSCDRVSEKMRWMAQRQTTRVEDIAYSLIGIFKVTMMNVAYGEGSGAFDRFMRVLAESCHDPSFLAWCGDSSHNSQALPRSPLCYHLDETRAKFLELSGFEASQARSGNPFYTVKKNGLKVKVLIIPIDESNPLSPVNIYILPRKPPMAIMATMAIPADKPDMELTRKRIRSAKRGRSYALGVVNYDQVQVALGHGTVSTKSRYFCLLLKRDSFKSWRREGTKTVVVLKCEGNFKDKVETITLPHTKSYL